MGRKKLKEIRERRCIRLTDLEWEVFKKLKLLKKIRKIIKNVLTNKKGVV